MTAFVKFSLRFAIYGVVVIYLIGDLFIFSGPLRKKIDANRLDSAEAIAAAKARGICARVFNHTITLDQVDRVVEDRLRREGGSATNRKLLRYAALDELIDHELLRVKTAHNVFEFAASPEEIDARMASVAAGFENHDAFEASLPAQGFPNPQAYRDHLAARIQQEKYVEARISPLVTVSEEELAAFRELHPEITDSTEIAAAIESAKRQQATADFRAALRQFEGHRIIVLHDVLAGE